MKNIILGAVGVIVFVGFMVWGLNYALTLNEINECLKWQKMADEYQGFYLTDWQKSQCDFHGVDIDIK